VPDDRGRLRQRFAAAVRIAAPLPESPDAAQPDFTLRFRFLTLGLLVIAGLGAAATTLGACSTDDFDRTAAIQQVVDEGDGRVTEDQAGCYVDRVRDEIGKAPLRPGATIPPEQIARLTTIRVDCIGVANLGADSPEPATVVLPEGGLPGPKKKGDDAALDALWDQCAAGLGQACDDLFDRAGMGTDYEAFAATCGQRTREDPCAPVYPAPGVTLPSPARASTTVPPPPP
jgi:hypothetical protein